MTSRPTGPERPAPPTSPSEHGHQISLGDHDGQRIWSAQDPTVLVIQDRPGSGASAGLAQAAVAGWGGFVLHITSGYATVDATGAARARRGQVWVLDPAGARPGTDRLELFGADTTSYARAHQVAAAMSKASEITGVEQQGFWQRQVALRLAPLLLAEGVLNSSRRTPAGDLGLADVQRWVRENDSHQPHAILASHGHQEAAEDLDHFQRYEERLRTNVDATVDATLAPYRAPALAGCIGPDGVSPARLMGGDHTIYACAPAAARSDTAAFLTLLTALVVEHAITREGDDGARHLLIVVEGAGTVARLDDLPALAAMTGRTLGVLATFTSLAQARATYGADATEALLDNSSATLVYPGHSPSVAAYLDSYAGNDVTGLPLGAGMHRLRTIPPHTCIALRSGHEPTLLDAVIPHHTPDLAWDLGL